MIEWVQPVGVCISNIGAVLLFEKYMPINSNLKTELLTPDELAQMLKISKSSVYRLIEKRVIRFHKVMGSIRFDKGDILSFLENNRVEVVGQHTYGSTKNKKLMVDRFQTWKYSISQKKPR